MTQKQFVDKYLRDALHSEKEKGISYLFILAQAALESGWGQSAPGNMFFGVKATKATPEHKRQLLLTTEILSDDKQGHRFPEVLSITRRPDGKYHYRVRDWFRKYDSPAECFSDHADLFYRNSRYAPALKVMHDPYDFADAIAKAGYATDPGYAQKLKTIIRQIEKIV